MEPVVRKPAGAVSVVLAAPAVPDVDPAALKHRDPVLLADNGSLSHGVGWQRQRGSGGARFVVCKISFMGTIRVIERYPLTEEGWASAWSSLVRMDPGAARAILARLAARNAPVIWPDAVFPALGVQVRGEVVETYAVPSEVSALGALAGAEARLTDGSQAWSPGRAMFLPLAFAGLATKTMATAFVVFADGSYHEAALDGNAAVRAGQAEAVKFNLMANPAAPAPAPNPAAAPAPQEDDVAATLRTLASLHDQGLLTDEEFAAKRAEVIARI